MKCNTCGGDADNLPSDMPPFIKQHIRNQRKVVEQRKLEQQKLAQRKMKSMVNYNNPNDRRHHFGTMKQSHVEIIELYGKQKMFNYEIPAQREIAVSQEIKRTLGVIGENEIIRESKYGMM